MSDSTQTPVAHMVYFKLKENNEQTRQSLIDACGKYLSSHPGTVFYAAGVLAADLARDVNDQDWDVSLHVVFKDRASHDAYQEAELHHQFIRENEANWAAVRVFDTDLGDKIVQNNVS